MNQVNCKSCGAVMVVDEPTEEDEPVTWGLQCASCLDANVPLPAGYEHLEGNEQSG